ncbi:MAG: hypothetical protein MR031_02785 [Tenericutes bacterium]|nr:hypothetical protein [Mycoplasmatota bacterium]
MKEEKNKKVEVKEEKKAFKKEKKEEISERDKKESKITNGIIIGTLVILLGVFLYYGYVYLQNKDKNNNGSTIENDVKEVKTAYQLSGNGLEDFDLAFLRLENAEKNKLYSPLSIKYTLAMLSEGADGVTKKQIDSVIGKYHSNKYTNSQNMSFANGMFVRDTYKDSIVNGYTDNLVNKYNAEVVYDSFINVSNINKWVSDRTFNLIDNMFDSSVLDSNFILVNALAIDMNWVNLIQSTVRPWIVSYQHEDYATSVESIQEDIYPTLEFNDKDGNKIKAKSVKIGASINNYDIVKTLGEDNIRKEISDKYQAWLDEGNSCGVDESAKDVNAFVDEYISELKTGYGQYSSSTDFMLYNDNDVKAFAKDLKTYNGVTLQYIGIMPKNTSLKNYVDGLKSTDVTRIISSLKTIEPSNFEQGKITKIVGNIPLFKFDYELKLKEDLETIGIKDVFDADKADLSKMTSQKAYIGAAVHKADIEFSNEGIKAAAATGAAGYGAASCGFEYLYPVPVEVIDLNFDNPYLFLIRDKDTGEVWFTGTVYSPIVNS